MLSESLSATAPSAASFQKGDPHAWLFDASVQVPIHAQLAAEFHTHPTLVRSAALDAIFALRENPSTVDEWKECVRVEVRASLASIAAKEKEVRKKRREERKRRVPAPATRVLPPRGVKLSLSQSCLMTM